MAADCRAVEPAIFPTRALLAGDARWSVPENTINCAATALASLTASGPVGPSAVIETIELTGTGVADTLLDRPWVETFMRRAIGPSTSGDSAARL
jgi:hypothetical protein